MIVRDPWCDRSWETDARADGSYEVSAFGSPPPTDFSVGARHPDWSSAERSFTISPDVVDSHVDLELGPPAVLIGRVVGPDGAPVVAARVEAIPASDLPAFLSGRVTDRVSCHEGALDA